MSHIIRVEDVLSALDRGSNTRAEILALLLVAEAIRQVDLTLGTIEDKVDDLVSILAERRS